MTDDESSLLLVGENAGAVSCGDWGLHRAEERDEELA